MADRIKLRRGAKSKLDLNAYELGYVTDSNEKRLYFNDGTMVPIPNDKDIKDIKNELKECENISNQNKKDVSELNKSVSSRLNERMKDICSITRNIANKKVKLIGDSITAGVGSSDYSCTGDIIYENKKVNVGVKCWSGKLKQYLENNFSCTVNNFGISGIKSNDVVSNISNLIKNDDDIIICMIGTNNRLVDTGDTILESNLRTIYNYVVSLNKDIIFMSPIPGTLKEETGKVGTTKYFQNYEVDNIYNKVCSELGIEYISLYKLVQSYLENTSTNLSNILDSSDQQHPNDYGYNILYNLILKSLGFSDRGNLENIYDTGWVDLTLNSGFTPNSNNKPMIRRIGKQVFLRGEFKWNAPSSNFGVAFSIPSGFAPSYEVDFEFTIKDCFADGFINNSFRIRSSNFTSNSPIQLSKVNPYLID